MRAFFVLAAVVALACAKSIKLNWDGDLNLTDASANFAFRFSNADVFEFPVIPDFLGWSSIDFEAHEKGTISASADAMIGFGVLPSEVTPPFVVMAYGTGKAAVNTDWKDFLNSVVSLSPSLEGFGSFKGNLVALAALGMQEMNSDNEPVGDFIPLFEPPLVSTKALWRCHGDEIEDDDDLVKGLTCKYSPVGNSADIKLTFLTSKVAGILEYGYTPVSPRSYEMVIEVSGFDLTNKKNHVRMSFGMFTVSTDFEIDAEAHAKVVHSEGGEDMYVAVSHRCVIDGDRTDVDVEIKSGSDGLEGFARTILHTLLGSKMDAQIAYVDFPAGEEDFIYDPAVGTGEVVYTAGSCTVALSMLVALLSVLVYLF